MADEEGTQRQQEQEEAEKELKTENDDPELLHKAREWDDFRDGKNYYTISNIYE